jgi:D-glycero-alpha-D-manno-heptose 1-phosphate guanylyltransferase
MEAIILAGGLGTRLRSVVEDTPKPMAPVAGRPFLSHQMAYWKKQGVTRFILSVGYLHEKIENYFSNAFEGVPLTYVVEKSPLGTGGALLESLLRVADPNFLLLNGDTWLKGNLSAMRKFHLERASAFTLGVVSVRNNDRYNAVHFGADARVTAFQEPNGKNSFINAGVYLIERNALLQMRFVRGQKFSLENDFLPVFCNEMKMHAFPVLGDFIDIGVPADYERAQSMVSAL